MLHLGLARQQISVLLSIHHNALSQTRDFRWRWAHQPHVSSAQRWIRDGDRYRLSPLHPRQRRQPTSPWARKLSPLLETLHNWVLSFSFSYRSNMPPPQIKQDINRSGWETTDFPSVCESCLPENPYVQMLKENYGAECKIVSSIMFRC